LVTTEAQGHGEYLARRHFSSLDGLRALSIVPIIWHHSTPYPLAGLLGQGSAGVSLFFCISGFLITTLLLREQRDTGRISLAAFYARRALRIFPLYYLVLLGYVAFAWRMPNATPGREHFFRSLPFFLTYTANWFVDFSVSHPVLFSFAWSLCIEEQFYCCWAPLVARVRSRLLLCCAVGALFVLGSSPGLLLLHSLTLSKAALRIATSFSRPIGWGALLAIALDDPRGFRILSVAFGRKWSAPLSLAVIIAILAFARAPGTALDLSLTALVGSCVVGASNGLAPFFELRIVSYFGRISYGLYLLHMTAIGLVRRLFPDLASLAPFVFGLSLPISFLLANATFLVFERRFLMLRARFRPSIP
jgi:peptidoglycan/LPS O-acetylase OafA/YrhL